MGWNTKYPIGLLVAKRADELNISRVKLMKRLGYANTDRGLRRFDDFIATGHFTTHLLKALPDVLGLDTAYVETASAATRQQIADREDALARERFHAHILVLAKREDGKHIPAFMQAWFWGNKVMGLPDDFNSMSSAQQVRQAARIVRQHYREHAGELGTWGTIIGYRLQQTYDHAVLLNTDGTVRDGFNREPEPPPPEIRIKGKRVPVGVFL